MFVLVSLEILTITLLSLLSYLILRKREMIV